MGESDFELDESDYDFFSKFMKPPDRPKHITVKFSTQDNKIFTQSYTESTSIEEMKNQLVDIFAIPKIYIDLKHDGNIVQDTKTLHDFNLPQFCALELKFSSNNEKYVIQAQNAYKDLMVPDVITVRVETEEGFKEVVVEVENRCIKKPFLGGFLNKESGITYHHGFSQTGPPNPKIRPEMKNHRDTQTYFTRNRKLDTRYSRATQMPNEELWIPTVNDKIIRPGKYETAEKREKRLNIDGKVRIIQRYFRAWKIKKAMKVLSAEYKKRIQKERELEAYNEQLDTLRKKQEIVSTIFPRTRKDFAMLYSMVEEWKKAEVERIKVHTCGPARIAEYYVLLEKEIELLRGIECQRKIVRDDMVVQKDVDFFHAIGDPIEWNSYYKNLHIKMDTLETQKGREYHELYLSIADRSISRDELLQALVNVKMHLNGHICQIALELVRLIDRACVLIARGLSTRHLDMLQKRIEGLLLHHFKQPECSFGVTNRVGRVKERLMENNLFYCTRCKTLKTSDQFALHCRSTGFKICKACSWDDRTLEPWTDLAPYRFMLRCIRREERRKQTPSSVVFILQDRDIHLLVTKVWHSHSAINECNDIYQLRLCRWFRDEDWAPWNSILLTKDEAKVHLEIKKLEAVYDQEFLHHIYNKHSLARKYYLAAFGLDFRFQEIGDVDTRWNEIFEFNEFVPVNSKSRLFLTCH